MQYVVEARLYREHTEVKTHPKVLKTSPGTAGLISIEWEDTDNTSYVLQMTKDEFRAIATVLGVL